MPANLHKQIAWLETQTDQRVQRVRHVRGGEYRSHAKQEWYAAKGIQPEPMVEHSPEANGMAERRNLT